MKIIPAPEYWALGTALTLGAGLGRLEGQNTTQLEHGTFPGHETIYTSFKNVI